MKLNFFNISRKKSTPDEIAEQIVALEIKQKQCESERDRAKKDCKDIRSRIMCGEKIPPDVVRNMDRAYEDAVLNLEAVTDSLQELEKSLHTAIETFCVDEKVRAGRLEKERSANYEETLRKIIRAKGRLVGLGTAIYQYPQEVEEQLRSFHSSINPASNDPLYAEYQSGVEEGMAEVKHPSVAELKNQYEVINFELGAVNTEERIQKLMEKYRALLNAPERKDPPEGESSAQPALV